ncbi:hypothetical protein BDZ45DRAFT_778411 [Acephala macrosclerotiorum]|nr:hypothetical protein BDZ45DRAFT_778411 [Acephala macrosclerotiorum]
MLDRIIWDSETAVPESVILCIDCGILKRLPAGTAVFGIFPTGESYWARTARLDAINRNGKIQYFMKAKLTGPQVHQGEDGKRMATTEFQAMEMLHKIKPDMVVEPVCYGSYESVSDTYFFVAKFVEMSGEVPSVEVFPALVADMHKSTACPKGTFGFPIETFGGNKAQMFPASETWEKCFTQGMKQIFKAELDAHEADEEMMNLEDEMMQKVIPRLLRPLETEGRSVTRTLMHGNLWAGNVSIDGKTGKPVIFNGTPLWGHNEYELGPWRCFGHKIDQTYIEEYIKDFPASEPTEDFDDRVALYSLRFDLHTSSLYPKCAQFREK